MRNLIKQTVFLAAFLLLTGTVINAQNVGINSTGSNPDGSAMLDISANDKGLLIPRVTLTGANDATTISSPATSLLVYNDGSSWGDAAYYFNSGTSGSPVWTKLSTAGMDGSGTTNYVARWTPDGTTLGNSIIQDDGSTVAVNAAPNASYTLYNNGTFYNNGASEFNGLVSTSNNIELGALAPGLKVIDFHAQAASDYDFRIVRHSGADAPSQILHSGTGDFHIYNLDAAPIYFATNAAWRMSILATGEIGINTLTPGSYQTNIVAADGNHGLRVSKNQNADGATFYGADFYASNPSASTTATSAVRAVAESNSGEVYGMRGITEHAGTADMYSVAGESWTFDQSTLNAAGYLGYFENAGTKGYNGFMGVLGIVEDNNGHVNKNSYAGYFSNTMDQSTTSGDQFGVYSTVNTQSFSSNDGSVAKAVYADATNAETLYGIHGEAKLSNWFNNDLMTGVYGNLSWSGLNYSEGYLAYNDSENDFTGINALVGVAGRVTDRYTNINKQTVAGYFENEYNGSAGDRDVAAYGVYADANGAGDGGSVNYGVYASASNAETNYAAVLDGDVKIGSNGTAVSNVMKNDIAIDPPSIAGYAQTDVTVAFANAAVGSTVMVSPTDNSHNGLIVCFAYVSFAGNVTIRFMNGTGSAIDGASINYHITVIE